MMTELPAGPDVGERTIEAVEVDDVVVVVVDDVVVVVVVVAVVVVVVEGVVVVEVVVVVPVEANSRTLLLALSDTQRLLNESKTRSKGLLSPLAEVACALLVKSL